MCALSELLVCCGHPHQHRSDTPASSRLNQASSQFYLGAYVCVCVCLSMCGCVSVCVCVVLLVFGIATASSLAASPLMHIHL